MPKIAASTVAEHRLRTWSALLDAMDALVLERPFESISMRDVALRAGVARTAIYNYAPDTVTLLIEATKRASSTVRDAVATEADHMSNGPAQRLRRIVSVLLTQHAGSTATLLAGLAIARTLNQEQFTAAVVPFRNEIGDYVFDVVRAGIQAGEFTPSGDPDLTRALMVGVMQAAVYRLGGTAVDDAAVAEATAQFLINALAGPAPAPAHQLSAEE